MINPQWLELPMSTKKLHGLKDVCVIVVRLYFLYSGNSLDAIKQNSVSHRYVLWSTENFGNQPYRTVFTLNIQTDRFQQKVKT